jgi:hypothetical protein
MEACTLKHVTSAISKLATSCGLLNQQSPSASESFPYLRINRQRLHAVRLQVHECSVMLDRPVSEQPREHSKSMIGQRLVNKRFLTFQGLQRTAARLSVIVERRIDQFRKKPANCTQARGASPIPPVLRLAQHELTAGGVVPQIKPLSERLSAYV